MSVISQLARPLVYAHDGLEFVQQGFTFLAIQAVEFRDFFPTFYLANNHVDPGAAQLANDFHGVIDSFMVHVTSLPGAFAPALQGGVALVILAQYIVQNLVEPVQAHHRVDADDFLAGFVKKNQGWRKA